MILLASAPISESLTSVIYSLSGSPALPSYGTTVSPESDELCWIHPEPRAVLSESPEPDIKVEFIIVNSLDKKDILLILARGLDGFHRADIGRGRVYAGNAHVARRSFLRGEGGWCYLFGS